MRGRGGEGSGGHDEDGDVACDDGGADEQLLLMTMLLLRTVLLNLDHGLMRWW